MSHPGEPFPASWRDTPQNRTRWEQMARNTAYLSRQLAARGSLYCRYCAKGPLRICHWSEAAMYADSLATVDHMVPLSRGGTDAESNLAVSCRRCNETKGDMIVRF